MSEWKRAEKNAAWSIGPFVKPINQPVLSASDKGFDSWAVYNPAVTFFEGKYYMYYRAESREEMDTPYMGTSRIGLAISTDGIHFEKVKENPVIDADLELEKPGGCEDPRICRVGELWYLLYTAYHYPENVYIFYAVSKDLIHWEKKGALLSDQNGKPLPSKSAAVLCDPNGNAARVDGKYILYTNEYLAVSENFEHWEVSPLEAAEFTGSLNEVCVAITDYQNPGKDDILLFFAGNFSKIQENDYFYAVGEALCSRKDPKICKEYLADPVIYATLPFEKTVDRLACVPESQKGTIFLDSVFRHEGKWYAYYGCADQFVGISICEPDEKNNG
ncbi:MAG: hypothetical protein ACI4EG_08590 [Fusicatenibacter sp.]